MKYVPVQQVDRLSLQDLAAELVSVRKRMHILPGTVSAWSAWLAAQPTAQTATAVAAVQDDAVTLAQVLAVRRMLKDIVGVPIDKNRLLYFEHVSAYRRRLHSTFIADTKHYVVVNDKEAAVLQRCRTHWEQMGWSRFCKFKSKGTLGFAQVLPKDKDCSLSRPIVPNCNHPLGRLYNMAARGFAYVLQHVKLSHFNLFTTQQFVCQLTDLATVVRGMVTAGEVCHVELVQFDVKDMYTEIQHSAIESCMRMVCDAWFSRGGHNTVAVSRYGRRGVTCGRSRSRADAATMPISVIVQILLYELRHAYFRVGTSTMLQQIMGVSMGSKGGPVLAWAVCMASEHMFHNTLRADARFIHVMRYFDDVWQLVLVPAEHRANPSAWVDRAACLLTTACYPASLRLIENSRGAVADMLSCTTFVDPEANLHCLHKNRNAPSFAAGCRPRFCRFVQYSSAHANGQRLMRNSVLGMFHRIHQDTLACDVPHLLPVLLCYELELLHAGFPPQLMPRVFRSFLQNPKVSFSQAWHELFRQFQQTVQLLWSVCVTTKS
jgi:hypothetical protein